MEMYELFLKRIIFLTEEYLKLHEEITELKKQLAAKEKVKNNKIVYMEIKNKIG